MNTVSMHKIIPILRKAVRPWVVPIVTQYKEDPFEVLISCLLSLRTKDAVTEQASKRLFEKARTPEAMLRLNSGQIEKLIYPVCFYRVKAKTLLKVCRILLDQYGGKVPDEIDELVKLPGVGRKTANLTVTLGFNKPGICVDTHVHRISNRLGYVKTKVPDETEIELRKRLPPKYWIEYNDLLVAYGQNLCKPISPLCSQCKIAPYCQRVGVGISR